MSWKLITLISGCLGMGRPRRAWNCEIVFSLIGWLLVMILGGLKLVASIKIRIIGLA